MCDLWHREAIRTLHRLGFQAETSMQTSGRTYAEVETVQAESPLGYRFTIWDAVDWGYRLDDMQHRPDFYFPITPRNVLAGV